MTNPRTTADGLNREVSRPCTRLLQFGAALLVLVALVGEVVRTPDELCRGGDGKRASHVQVHTENHSVLGTIIIVTGFLAFRSVDLVVRVLQRDVQVERVVLLVVLERGARHIPVVVLVVPAERRVFAFVLGWEDVFGSDSAVRRGQRGVIVVE